MKKQLAWSSVNYGTIYVCIRFLRTTTNRTIHNSNINFFTSSVVNLRAKVTKPHTKLETDEEYDPERPFQGRPDLIFSSDPYAV